MYGFELPGISATTHTLETLEHTLCSVCSNLFCYIMLQDGSSILLSQLENESVGQTVIQYLVRSYINSLAH